MNKKTVLLTGGSRGIGKNIVKILNEDYNVFAPSREEMDLKNDKSIENYLENLDKRIDILVNCAGILKVGKCEELTTADFEEILRVNLISPFKIISKLVQDMKHAKYGKIVNISSIWSLVSKEGRCLYSASKAGLDGLTKSLALELAPYNILVNSVAPGYVNTDMIKLKNSSEDLEIIKKNIPLQRFAETYEIAELVKFLCSEKNTYITGKIIPIDGGYLCK